MTCKNCGKENNQGEAFCAACGNALSENNPAQNTQATKADAAPAQNPNGNNAPPAHNAGHAVYTPPPGWNPYAPPAYPAPSAAPRNSWVMSFVSLILALNTFLFSTYLHPATIILGFLFGLASMIIGIVAFAYNPTRTPRTPLKAAGLGVGISIYIYAMIRLISVLSIF